MSDHQEDSPAFPIVHPDGKGVQYFGMTLRDYFAAKAMQGLLAAQAKAPHERRAEFAYEMADAMLQERAK